MTQKTGPIPGGWTEEQDVSPDIIKTCEEIKSKLEEQCGHAFTKYTPLKFRSQVVAGINLAVKIAVDSTAGEDYIHVRIFEPLSGKPELINFEGGHTKNDPIKV